MEGVPGGYLSRQAWPSGHKLAVLVGRRLAKRGGSGVSPVDVRPEAWPPGHKKICSDGSRFFLWPLADLNC